VAAAVTNRPASRRCTSRRSLSHESPSSYPRAELAGSGAADTGRCSSMQLPIVVSVGFQIFTTIHRVVSSMTFFDIRYPLPSLLVLSFLTLKYSKFDFPRT
jgi:hypothetical protein